MDNLDRKSQAVVFELRFEFFGQRNVVANHQYRFGVFNVIGKLNAAVIQNERFAGTSYAVDYPVSCPHTSGELFLVPVHHAYHIRGMERKIILVNLRSGWVNANIGIKMPSDAVKLLRCCVMNEVMFEKGFESGGDLLSCHKLVEFVFAYHLAGRQYFI